MGNDFALPSMNDDDVMVPLERNASRHKPNASIRGGHGKGVPYLPFREVIGTLINLRRIR